MEFIQARMSPLDRYAQPPTPNSKHLKAADLNVLITPYVIVGLVILALFFLIYFTKMPKQYKDNLLMNLGQVLKRIFGYSSLS